MKPLVIYHAHCVDGFTAAWCAWKKFVDAAEYRAANYGDPAPTSEECSGRDVYVLDFSYPRAELERMARATCAPLGGGVDEYVFHLLDHHKTAQADLAGGLGVPGGCYVTFDMNKSGARLAWEHFHSNESVPALVAYVEDRDLWRWKLPQSKEVSACISSLPKLWAEWDAIAAELDDVDSSLATVEGTAILRAQGQAVESIANHAEEVILDNVNILAVNSCIYQSEVGERLAHEAIARGRAPVGVVYFYDGVAKKWRVSLRSRDYTSPDHGPVSFDVSAIAKVHGGGGHKNAAGFECEVLPWRSQ